jgi:hypothetical protein
MAVLTSSSHLALRRTIETHGPVRGPPMRLHLHLRDWAWCGHAHVDHEHAEVEFRDMACFSWRIML